MKRTTLMMSLVAMVFVIAVAAQERPDFSGAWQSTPMSTQGTASLGSGWGPSFTIVQDRDSLTVERLFFSRGDLQPPLKFRYSLDGLETRNKVMMGRGIQEQVSRVAWEGNKLVITTIHTFANPEDRRSMTAEVKQVLSLQPTRRAFMPPSLVIETTRSGALGGPPSTTRTTYSKR
jgi:hypothetical protein